jgi:two-component system, cell cycle sensor histidine kinase and response regulator CckA
MIERVNVNEAVLEIRPLMGRLLGDEIELVVDLDQGFPCHALLDRRRLEHALLNLVVNARDALVEGGKVTIQTLVVERDERPWVKLSVADTGVGMTEEVRVHAFDSFFTTKADSGGIGLGLASVRRFAEDIGGLAMIETAAARGTTVTILLAAQPPPTTATPSASEVADAHAKHAGQVLLVADRDERVRKSVELALEAEGFVVLLAATRDQALELAVTCSIDVALLDDRLLKHDNAGLLHELRERCPQIRFVFMSDLAPEDWVLDGSVTVLSKAFSSEDLLRAVRRAIDLPS